MATATRRDVSPDPALNWQQVLLAMLPAIRQHAELAFATLGREAREEAVQEVVCNCCCAVARLAELGKLDRAFPSALARYGVAQARGGRKVGGRLNCRDVLSPYCQRLKRLTVERLDRFDQQEEQWMEAVVEDTRTAPVPEIVSFRLDFADWLAGLPRWKRRIAQFLALGHRTCDAARKFRRSAGRISQLRLELKQAWERFIGEGPTAVEAG